MKRLMVFLCCAAVIVLCTTAMADTVLFSNSSTFVSTTGATLHPLPTGPNNTAITGTSLTTTDGQLTLSIVPGSSTSLISNWGRYPGVNADRLSGPDLAISGTESFNANVLLGADKYAFGFGIYEPTNSDLSGCSYPCTNSTFMITLLHDGSAVGSTFTLSPEPNNTALFWGVQTTYAFNGIRIRETVGTADNEIFGTFYTGTTPVPEPATLTLMGAGLASLLARRKQKKG